jgi:hypothetical protein
MVVAQLAEATDSLGVCWNWHTGWSQKPLPKGLWVQVPPLLPINSLQICGRGEIGKHKALKMPTAAGSSPAARTNFALLNEKSCSKCKKVG